MNEDMQAMCQSVNDQCDAHSKMPPEPPKLPPDPKIEEPVGTPMAMWMGNAP